MTKPLNVHILFVDDEVDAHYLFKAYFAREMKNSQVRLSFSASAEECLHCLKSERGVDIILVLSDINMPGMSGLDLLPILHKDFPRVAVYMITAYDTPEHREKSMDRGARRFFTKPVNIRQLKHALNEDFGLEL